jgi:hypothetical protein
VGKRYVEKRYVEKRYVGKRYVGKLYVGKLYVGKDVNIDVIILSSKLSCKMVRVLPPRFFPEVLAASSAGVFGAPSFPKMGFAVYCRDHLPSQGIKI